MYLRGNAAWEGRILTGTLLEGSKLLVDFDGQVSSGPIIGNEQFSLGGRDSVRGYFQTQGLVDHGVRGRFELQSPSVIGDLDFELFKELRGVTFVEAGHGRTSDPLPGQDEAFSLASTGIGLRLQASHGLTSAIDWAFPLIENSEIEAFESRFHFTFGYEF
jgi:hemolysin activation/secretion protein